MDIPQKHTTGVFVSVRPLYDFPIRKYLYLTTILPWLSTNIKIFNYSGVLKRYLTSINARSKGFAVPTPADCFNKNLIKCRNEFDNSSVKKIPVGKVILLNFLVLLLIKLKNLLNIEITFREQKLCIGKVQSLSVIFQFIFFY